MNHCLLVVHTVERARLFAQFRLVQLPVSDADRVPIYRVERVCLAHPPTATVASCCIRPVDSVPLQADRGVVCYTVLVIAGQIGHGTSVAVSTAIVHNRIHEVQAEATFVLRLQGSADICIANQVPTIKRNYISTSIDFRTLSSHERSYLFNNYVSALIARRINADCLKSFRHIFFMKSTMRIA